MNDNKELINMDDTSVAYKELLGQLEPDTNLAGGMFGLSRRVSIRGMRFRKIINGEEVQVFDGNTLDVVIVSAAQISRMFYEKGYVEGETSEPTCWSPDGKIPSVDVPTETKQCGDCAHCPQNVKGSGQNDTRACRYQQRVAILLAGADGEGITTKEIYAMIIPATSIFGGSGSEMSMQGYARYLQAHKTPSKAIVTEMRFDAESSTPKLFFKPVRPLTDEELAIVVEMQTHQETVDAITQHVYVSDGENSGEVPALPAAFGDDVAKAEEDIIPEKKETAADKKKRLRKEKLLAQLAAMDEDEKEPKETAAEKKERLTAEKKAKLQAQLAAMDEDEDEDDAPPVTAKAKTPKPETPDDEKDLSSILDKWDD